MRHCYPAYYPAFTCIAAACPDSCCQGWDVVIDSETEAFYQTVTAPIGGAVRAAICTDADGDRIFRLKKDKKCPFWGEDRLCDIYRALGENYLCATCALFPRIRMEYAGFTEHTLALACPEAARLILLTEHAYADFFGTVPEDCEDYGAEEMRLLLDVRNHAARLLTADKPLQERLEELLRYCGQIQGQFLSAPEDGSLSRLYEQMEYIDEAHRALFSGCALFRPDLSADEKELTNLALYYLYRYLLSAIDTGDVLSPAAFAVYSVVMIAALSQKHGMTLARAAQLYSKEIEQSYENRERMWDWMISFSED